MEAISSDRRCWAAGHVQHAQGSRFTVHRPSSRARGAMVSTWPPLLSEMTSRAGSRDPPVGPVGPYRTRTRRPRALRTTAAAEGLRVGSTVAGQRPLDAPSLPGRPSPRGRTGAGAAQAHPDGRRGRGQPDRTGVRGDDGRLRAASSSASGTQGVADERAVDGPLVGVLQRGRAHLLPQPRQDVERLRDPLVEGGRRLVVVTTELRHRHGQPGRASAYSARKESDGVGW